MNLALSSLLLLFFLFPGLLFSRFYYSGEFSKQYVKTTLLGTIVMSLVPSIVLHLAGYYIHGLLLNSGYINHDIDFNVLANLLSPTKDLNIFLEQIKANLNPIIKYHLLLWLSSALLGVLAKLLVRVLWLDRGFKILRYQNKWHYLLTGEILQLPKIVEQNLKGGAKILGTHVDVLCTAGEQNILYKGWLVDYNLGKDNTLELIHLRMAHTKKLHESSFKPINGLFLTIKYDQIKNINLSYVREKTSKRHFFKVAKSYWLGRIVSSGFVLFLIGLLYYLILHGMYIKLIALVFLLIFIYSLLFRLVYYFSSND